MPRPTLNPIKNPKYYYEPFKTQCPGFNTEFSVEELRNRILYNNALSEDEIVFIDYLKIKGLW